MGMLALNRLMSLRRDRRRRRRHHRPQIRARSGGLIASTGKRKTSPCQQDDYDGDSQAGKIMRNSIPDLPEDILFRIQSFMSMREATRAACVSRAFLHSWRCHPNLIFNKDMIGLKRNAFGENFHRKIGRILRNHSGISLKTFQLDYSGMCGFDGTSYLDSWLQIALKPEMEELTLFLPETNRQYSFPCSLLSDGQLSSLNVVECSGLKVIESKAPNLSSLFVKGSRVNFSLVETLQIKKLDMGRAICDARAKLPSIMPNLETLIIESGHEVTQVRMVHESIFTDSQLRHIPGHRHGHLKSVKITGFSSAKSLVELTCYILNNAVSLECLTLDTIYGPRCDQDKYRRCFPMIDGVLTEAPRGLAAIRTYIEDKVPSTVNLIVLEPCSRCHVRRRG
uniref:At1g61320/AtMIF1 LRR domain-containing protein n=1 Tax=Oryza glumipatula TaxID=40148 RepID=A0A0D9ZM62_9ORYZ